MGQVYMEKFGPAKSEEWLNHNLKGSVSLKLRVWENLTTTHEALKTALIKGENREIFELWSIQLVRVYVGVWEGASTPAAKTHRCM